MKDRKKYKALFYSIDTHTLYCANKRRNLYDDKFYLHYERYEIIDEWRMTDYDYVFYEAYIQYCKKHMKIEKAKAQYEQKNDNVPDVDEVAILQERIKLSKEALTKIYNSPEYIWHKLQS